MADICKRTTQQFAQANTVVAALAELGNGRQVNVSNERIQSAARHKPVCQFMTSICIGLELKIFVMRL
jgi:hypothetical protein